MDSSEPSAIGNTSGGEPEDPFGSGSGSSSGSGSGNLYELGSGDLFESGSGDVFGIFGPNGARIVHAIIFVNRAHFFEVFCKIIATGS